MGKRKFKNKEEFVKVLSTIRPSLTVIGEYKNLCTKIECKCEKGHKFFCAPIDLLKKPKEKNDCPVCSNYIVIPEINSFWALHPELQEFIHESSISDAKKYSCGAKNVKLKINCPDCHNIYEITIETLNKKGLVCPICKDTLSYPNSMLREIMNCLSNQIKNIQFEYDVLINDKHYYYDASFYINDKHFFIEMDGNFHFYNGKFSKKSLKETKRRDKLKNQFAIDNNIKLIRISCEHSDFEEIKNNFMNSEIKEYLDLSVINWEKCDKNAQRNETKYIATIISLNSGKYTINELSSISNYKWGKIKKAYIKGIKFGWCKENDMLKNGATTPIRLINNKTNKIIKIYRGFKDCNEDLKQQGKSTLKFAYPTCFNNLMKKLDYKFERLTKEEYYDYLKSILILPEDNKEGE